ncbi:TonB-dependent receptor [Hymenobacter sp. BT175]|uniref:TonB-dependent receptor n=1 Tax=Hymenobacter translucens TaxID=2886507 RepID=UPI001D0E47EB|nr:TonB-dependent receptor [Hymenobacter translucens]MCC2545036.1 TonB-dependent receptor [Hymenobacter translucens]
MKSLSTFFLLLALLLSSGGYAQTGTVTGSLRTAGGGPVEFATVTLHRAADSVVVRTEFSDAQGAFKFETVKAGRYILSASQVGFVRSWVRAFEAGTEAVTLTPIVLQKSGATQLKEVTVVGQKPLFERLADRTVVNVEGSTLAAGNTSLDVLSRSPGVTVDGNDNIGLRGRQGVLVLIDGKRQPMTGTELADYLRALPAEQLKSIELITNPPAKYEAQGSAGIIAINLRKDQRLGTNGSVNASYGQGRFGKFNSGLTLNNRQRKTNLYGSYNYGNRKNYGALTIHRDFFETTDQGKRFDGSSDQDNYSIMHSQSHSWKAGLDYTLTERTTLGVALNGLRFGLDQDGTNNSVLYGPTGTPQLRYRSSNTRDITSPNYAGNLNFKHTFQDSLGNRELTADADYARYDTRRLQALNTIYFRSPNDLLDVLEGDQNGKLSIQSVKVDYAQPLTKQLRLEAGGKVSLVSSDNDVVFRVPGPDGVGLVRDPRRSNRFRYDENINALYVNFNQTTPKWTLQAGLRGEQTNAVGKQDVKQAGVDNQEFTRNYYQLFPSAAAKYSFSDKNETSASLSRRIDRPSYGQLNPFRSYIDATTYGAGNPELRPQTSYNVELTHTFRQKYSVGLAYSRTDNPITGTVQPDSVNSRTVVSTSQNLDVQHYYALTLTAPLEPVKGLQIYNNAVFYYSRFVGNLVGTSLNAGRPAFTLSTNGTYSFGKGWSADLNARYQSRELYAFFDTKPLGQLALGVQKSLWNRKGNLKLNVTDVFYTGAVRATSTYSNYVERFYQRGDFRVATLAFSYRFGNEKVAPTRRRQSGAEDEKRRAGGS